MHVLLRRWVLLVASAVVVLPAYGSDVVAEALGETLRLADLPPADAPQARISLVRTWLLRRLLKEYIVSRGLAATPEELSELHDYDREFDRRDRAQRARKLAELDRRLADDTLDSETRAWLGEFRRVLARMAGRDAANDVMGPDAGDEAVDYAPWLEYWKALPVLYEEYGGPVAATESGMVPYGALTALFAHYERAGRVVIGDKRLREQVYESLRRPPGVTVPPEQVDFTPYWKRPIPPSYYPDDARGQ